MYMQKFSDDNKQEVLVEQKFIKSVIFGPLNELFFAVI